MEYSEKDKVFMKQISDGLIYDIESFVKIYYSTSKFKYNKSEIQEKKKSDYENNEHKIDKYINEQKEKGISSFRTGYSKELGGLTSDLAHDDFSDDELETCRKKMQDFSVRESDFKEMVAINEKNYLLDTLKKEVYCIDDISLFRRFFSLIDNLIYEDYILLVENDSDWINAFFKKTKREDELKINESETEWVKNFQKQLSSPPLPLEKLIDLFDNMNNRLNDRYIYEESDKYYSEEYLKPNEELINLCERYFNKKIHVKDKLSIYVNNNFQSEEQVRYVKSRKQTWIAIIVSAVFAFASLIASLSVSISLNKNNNTFWRNNEKEEAVQLEEISSGLDEIVGLLKIKNASDLEINSKFEDLLELLSELLNDPD